MTRTLAEEIAEGAIRQAGYRVYLPRYRKILRGVRLAADGRRIRTRGAGEVVLRPLFAGYIFVECHPGQDDVGITGARGVKHILRHRPDAWGYCKPKLLTAEVIAEIRAAEVAGVFDQARAATPRVIRTDLTVGANVRTVQGYIAQIASLDEAGRVQLVQKWFGAERRVAVDDPAMLELV